MTPHHHWFKTYMSLRVPIRLADESVIYSAGVGSVEFSPLLKGKQGKVVEFERVLHVPDLRNNLLSVFYLTKQKGFVVTVNRDSVYFRHNGILMFTATVGPQNTGYLDGHVIPNSEVASVASTCPLDISLWHRRLSHRNVADVQKTLQEKLVTGMVINSNAKPDPICEPCLAGGQHRGPIPKTASSCAKDLLGLVHSDVKGPLPVRTPEGYQFWVTFIDDKSHFGAVYLLRSKDEVYGTFKMRYMGHSKGIRHLWKHNWARRSRCSGMTKVANTFPTASRHTSRDVVSKLSTHNAMNHIRMVLLKEPTALLLKVSLPFSMKLTSPLHFGDKPSMPLSIPGTAYHLHHLHLAHPIPIFGVRYLISVIFVSLVALPMSISSLINAVLWNHTARSASLLGILSSLYQNFHKQ